ncbi:MAG TPA: serine/threonine-protein kinase [Steroidobacteraceae bacterium]|nr:serine/threonine-protein kinase [Steroidobacteraceae bacterium]
MTAARKQRIEQVFLDSLEIPPSGRAEFVRQACAGDEALRAEIEAMLTAADRSERFFDSLSSRIGSAALLESALTSGDHEPDGTPRFDVPGAIVGPYRLVRELGHGGMATVWLAERADGLIERPVALKFPHGAWRMAGLAERMALERRFLAALTHPNIARLYDAGLTADGQPWLALEYVEGKPFDQYCLEGGLSVRERLGLFIQVARAVAHAHSQLIVHRDLKPSNVLVTAAGDVRLLDFGIARLVAEDNEATQLTAVSGRALTIDYASPEQILGQPVSTASDVYSLGVLLFEILSGKRPYLLSRESRGALEEAILEADPPRPSDTAPPADRKSLRGDLDTIVLKALKKQPQDRYATVDALIADIERHLASEPVLARPDSAIYRAQRFVRRHRAGVAMAALGVIVLLGATAGSLRYAQVTAEQSRRIALERERADSLKLFLVDTLKEADPNRAPADLTVKAAVQQRFGAIREEFQGDPETRSELLAVFAEVFEVLRLADQQKEALNLRLELLEKNPGRISAAYADTLAARARAEEKLGDYEAGFATAQQALEINRALGRQAGIAGNLHQLGLLHHLKGEYQAALPFYEQALAMRAALFGEDSLEYAETLYELGVLDDERGVREPAEARLRQVLAIREQRLGKRHTAVAEALAALGVNQSGQKKLEAGIELNQQALAIYEQLFGPDSRYAYIVVNNLGHDHWRKGDLPQALIEFRKTLELTRKYYPDHPDEGIALVNIADLAYNMNDLPVAFEHYQAALPIFEKHMPSHAKLHIIRLRIGVCLGKQGRFHDAEAWFTPAFLALESSDIFSRATVKRAANDVISVYTAWGGHQERIGFYRSFLD